MRPLPWLTALTLGFAAPAQQAAVPSTHWAFQPLAAVAPPAVAEAAWNQNPVDRFVRARLDAAGIRPSPPADRRTLLRRAAFALTGLPPTADDVEAFVADPAPTDVAFARCVDALLASPHYGEQQARHWLDLARYSDSNGLDENLAFGNAWRYRDWVVAAHNQDLPYDRFVTMQLAGDLLADDPAVSLDGYVATGFLALGPRMLAEQDKDKLVLDTIDEQIDVVGRTVLGLTLGCARCHDHKFDPVPTADYYALAGIFRSTRAFRDLDHVSKWFDRGLESDAAVAARHAAETARDEARRVLADAEAATTEALRHTASGRVADYLLAAAALAAAGVHMEAEQASATSLHRDDRQWGSADCVVLHTSHPGPQFAEWRFTPPAAGRYQLLVRYAAAESRPMRVSLDGAEVAANALAATTGGWLPTQQCWHDAAEVELTAGGHALRLEALGPHAPHLDALVLLPTAPPAAAGLLPPVVRRCAALLQNHPPSPLLDRCRELPATDPTALPAAAEAVATLVTRCVAALDAQPADRRGKLADPELEAVRALWFESGGPFAFDLAALAPWLPAEARDALQRHRDDLAARTAAVPPPAPTVMCVADGELKELPVHFRGNPLTLAPTITPRGFLSVFAGQAPWSPLPADQSGRLQLAQWLVSPQQPLVPRVLANRIWQRAFGEGLVRSPSNFGVRGDTPALPELLDWLARDLRDHGWSQKHLWRLLLTSRTWQQTSSPRDDAATIDPEDRLWWRQRRVRLEAEALRDAMLVAAGRLDPTMGGSLLTTADRGYVTNDQSNDQARYDAPRRSLYLPIVRNAMFDMFCAFDYVDPSVHLEQRPASAIATQALYLLNAPFAHAQAKALAAQALDLGDDDAVTRLWRQALQRAPTAEERAAARRWLARAGDFGREGLARTLLAGSEFLYLD